MKDDQVSTVDTSDSEEAYLAVLRDVRALSDSMQAEAQEFRATVAKATEGGERMPPMEFAIWDLRVQGYLAFLDAYLGIAERFAADGRDGLRTVVVTQMRWLAMLKPDADDLN